MNQLTIQRPNILLIVADQLRQSALGCWGNPDVSTPAIDHLAREGLRFTHNISTAPVCAPYRATLQSGLYPHQHGVKGNGDLMRPSFKGLAEYFNGGGYDTCYVGKSHFGRDEIEEKDGWVSPENQLGWKRWYGTGGDHHYDTPVYKEDGSLDTRYYGQYGASVRTGIAIDYLMKEKQAPWLLQVNYSEPHVATMPALYQLPATRERARALNRQLGFNLPEEALDHPNPLSFYDTIPQHLLTQLLPQEYLDQYDPEALHLDPNVPERQARLVRYFLKEYYAMVSCLDDQVAKLLRALEETGELERTIVIFTADHGDMLSNGYLRFKGVPYQTAYRTPMVLRGPGVKPGISGELFSSVDLLPTLLDLAGIEKPPLPGVSLAPAIREGATGLQRDVLLGLATWRGIYNGEYFYAADNRSGSLKPARLIHLATDPYDLDNLAEKKESQPLRETLHSRLIERLREAGDLDFLAGRS